MGYCCLLSSEGQQQLPSMTVSPSPSASNHLKSFRALTLVTQNAIYANGLTTSRYSVNRGRPAERTPPPTAGPMPDIVIVGEGIRVSTRIEQEAVVLSKDVVSYRKGQCCRVAARAVFIPSLHLRVTNSNEAEVRRSRRTTALLSHSVDVPGGSAFLPLPNSATAGLPDSRNL